jgi:hypothetical protein
MITEPPLISDRHVVGSNIDATVDNMGIEGTTRLRHQRMIAASCSGPILLEP